MLTVQTIMELVTSSHLTDSLVDFMEKHFEDFPSVHQRYLKAMEEIQAEFIPGAELSVTEEAEAIRQKIASTLRFSYFLGAKANLDHFTDPVARTFLEVDPEVYLRENTARLLPEYVNAQERQNRFYGILSPSQRLRYEDVIEYICYLETVGPKLAHYIGYMTGNELFPRTVPGYHSDWLMTSQYKRMLEQQLGIKNMSLLCGLVT